MSGNEEWVPVWEEVESWVVGFSIKNEWRVRRIGMDSFDLYQEAALVFLNCVDRYEHITKALFGRLFFHACRNRVMDLVGTSGRALFRRSSSCGKGWLEDADELDLEHLVMQEDMGFQEVDLRLDCEGAWKWIREELLQALQGVRLTWKVSPRKKKEAQLWCREVLGFNP